MTGQERRGKPPEKYLNALVDTRSEFIRVCIYGVIASLILSFLMFDSWSSTGEALFWSVLRFFLPFGWKLLTYVQSFMPFCIIGTIWFWLCHLLCKVFLSILIGIPVFVYQLIKTFFVQRKIQAVRQPRRVLTARECGAADAAERKA